MSSSIEHIRLIKDASLATVSRGTALVARWKCRRCKKVVTGFDLHVRRKAGETIALVATAIENPAFGRTDARPLRRRTDHARRRGPNLMAKIKFRRPREQVNAN